MPVPDPSPGTPASAVTPRQFLALPDQLHNEYLAAWSEDHRGVVGFYCSTIPEELLHAADLFPYRIRANTCADTAHADALLSRFNCSFIRCSLNLALEGAYDFLDGMLVSSSCDHVRRMYEMWERKVKPGRDFPLFFLSVPRVVTPEGTAFLLQEYQQLQQAVEHRFDVSITTDALRASIALYNENRRLLQEVHALRGQEVPKISGADFVRLAVANQSVPREIANGALKRVIAGAGASAGYPDRTRLMLVGSYVDNPGFLDIFEEVGGIVVSDSLCTSGRYFQDLVPTSGDPLEALGQHYYRDLFCPRMMDRHPARLEFVKAQVKAAGVEGVVLERMEFCDLHGCDNMLFQEELTEDLGIPVLNIDREYLLGDVARFKTRVEAFIEQIRVS